METTRAWTQLKHDDGTPLKWNKREIEMEVRLGGGTSETCHPKVEGVDLYEFGPCWDDVIKSAADQWYRTDARVRINIKSSSAEPGCTIGDGINTVTSGTNYCGHEFGKQTLGVAFNRYRIMNGRGRLVESNVVFNTAFFWNSYSGPERWVSPEVSLGDMHRVAVHEFGHTWGLDHPDEAGQEVVAIMNSIIKDIDRLQQDDIDGIVGIYGANPNNPPLASSGNIELDDTGVLAIDEGGIGTFTVKLDTRPYADVTVDVTSADSGVVTVNPASLIFNASNHSSPQELTVTALHDIDIDDETVDITLSAIGGIVASDVKKSVAINDDDEAGSLVMQPSPLQVVKGGQESLLVRLGTAPTVSGVVVSLAGTNSALSLNPTSLTFTAGNWSADQTVTVSAAENDNASDTITGSYLNATGNYASAAGAQGATVDVLILDRPGDIVTSAQLVDLMEGGEAVEFTVRLGEAPVGTDNVTVALSNSNRDITLTPPMLLFTSDNWSAERIVTVQAGEDDDQEEDYDFIVLSGTGGNYSRSESTVSVSVEENDESRGFIGGTLGRNGVYALAIPPESGSDSSDIRIRCKQSSRCAVYFDCSAQEDGRLFRGWLPALIPAWGTRTVVASDIIRYTGGLSWSGKGRLGCLLRSKERIGAQVWTRSGDGVLVNNSALLKSALDSESGKQRADIESIPSPDGNEKTNLRIRCLAPEYEHCTRTAISCYTDAGTLHEGQLGRIDRLTVRHIQTSELSSLIGHRWQSMGLSCELRSDNHFTVQVMTRTGGGGALVNNSAR